MSYRYILFIKIKVNIKRHFPTSYLGPYGNDPVEVTLCCPVLTHKMLGRGRQERREGGEKKKKTPISKCLSSVGTPTVSNFFLIILILIIVIK